LTIFKKPDHSVWNAGGRGSFFSGTGNERRSRGERGNEKIEGGRGSG
jgi:hypothetical protein